MSKVFNFSAGPAMLPEAVMHQAREEFLDWNGLGSSVMEISHRSSEFKALADESVALVKQLLSVPDNYHILFLHGGARTQFAMLPLNLMADYKFAAYVQTGVWGRIAAKEAALFANIDLIADTEASSFTSAPAQSAWKDHTDAAYLYYVDNETVNGVEFPFTPDAGDVPLVGDMSSNILSRPVDVSKFGVLFACAQKNLGAAGITLVIIRDDLLDRPKRNQVPSMLSYRAHVDAGSMQNTPPTYPWYISTLVLRWVKQQGGLSTMNHLAQRKSQKLYDVIDHSDFYGNNIEADSRSRMNVVFRLPNEALEKQFVQEASAAGMSGLKGHRLVGGIRASIYNAMPEAGVDHLVEFMREFERVNG